MRRAIVVGLAFALATLIYPTRREAPPEASVKQRFGLELEACRRAQAEEEIPGKCELYGKIEVVDEFGDVEIERVDAFGDIKVEWVDAFADEPGEWERVDAFGDYEVEFVDAFGDYTIEEVDAFPGCGED